MHYEHRHYLEIDSTNTYLKNQYALLSDFTFVSTDYQTQGKGREVRSWASNRGENLLFSLLLKSLKYFDKAPYYSIYTAVEVAKLLVTNKVKHVSIKWPNDVYVDDKKVCGILLESQIPSYLVIGVGLNVNQKEFPIGLRRPATSLAIETSKSFNLESLRKKLFKQIFQNFSHLDHEQYLTYFRDNNYLLHKKIKVNYQNQDFVGEVVGIDDNFGLQVKNDQLLLHVESGEITIDENFK